jgi:hypothetical protein
MSIKEAYVSTIQLCNYNVKKAMGNTITDEHCYIPIKLYLETLKLEFHIR